MNYEIIQNFIYNNTADAGIKFDVQFKDLTQTQIIIFINNKHKINYFLIQK
jgi:hypothetical protein